jgi:hypothetical protein
MEVGKRDKEGFERRPKCPENGVRAGMSGLSNARVKIVCLVIKLSKRQLAPTTAFLLKKYQRNFLFVSI